MTHQHRFTGESDTNLGIGLCDVFLLLTGSSPDVIYIREICVL